MKVLVIGASDKPTRTSYRAIHLLNAHDHEVVAIGRKKMNIGGIEIETGFPIVENIHTVTLYLNPSLQPQFYEYILGLIPKRIIFNPGTENSAFYKRLTNDGIYYEEACTLVMLRTGQF